MARVKSFVPERRSSSAAHPTEVECRWQVVSPADGGRLFQLSTYGSDDRVSEPKVSQTIQIDRAVAVDLVRQLTAAFDL